MVHGLAEMIIYNSKLLELNIPLDKNLQKN